MLVTTLLTGALAGALATAPMTFTMEVLHRRLPLPDRYPLPPREITMNIAERTGVKHRLRWEERAEVSLVAHFAYGALVGALYSAFADKVVRPSPLTGIVFGLGVWGASYLGLLPAMGLFPPATREPQRRNLLMLIAHVVWGAALGALVRARRPQAL